MGGQSFNQVSNSSFLTFGCRNVYLTTQISEKKYKINFKREKSTKTVVEVKKEKIENEIVRFVRVCRAIYFV